MKRKRIYTSAPLLLIFIAMGIISAQQRADFVIIESVSGYTLYNHYEVPLSSEEKKALPYYLPFQIIDENAVLGDQISTAVKVKFDDKIYYLLKDDKGKVIGDAGARYKKRFSECQLLNDTIQILRNSSLYAAEKYPLEGKKAFLQSKARVIRVFRYQGYWYLRYSVDPVKYGWSTLSPQGSWSKVETDALESVTIDENVYRRVVERLESANKSYKDYFNYFNEKTGEQKLIPVWRYSQQENVITCSLNGVYAQSDILAESTQYLIQDLENSLIGKPFYITFQNGTITIKAKK